MSQTLQNDKTETIVVTKSLYRLKRFLRSDRNDRGRYICFSSPSHELKALLAEHGAQPQILVCSSPDRQEAILHDYIEAIGRLGEWNGHISNWWMTDIASKNAYRSPLLQPLHELVHCLDAIQTIKGSNSTLFIIDPSWPTVMAIKHVALHNRWNLRILFWPWSRIIAKWSGKTKAWIEMFRSAIGTLREIVRTRKHYGNMFNAKKEKESVYLIKSFVYPYSFKDDGSYQDPFFGKLADHLVEQLAGKVKVITIALGFTSKRYCYEKMKTLKGSMVIPFESMLRYTDVIQGFCLLFWMLISKPFKVRENVEFLGHDIADLLHELLGSGGWRIPFYQYIYCFAGERLAKQYHLVACTLTHENNPWERAFIAGIRKINPDTRIIGYQHSVIHLASANMFQSQREMSKIPAPDVVLTTGTVPTNILCKYGAFPEERIKVSCALRYNYLDEIQPQLRHISDDHEKRRILVALCGVIETLPLLRYVIDQAHSHPYMDFLIRAHPVLPFEKLQLLFDHTNVLPTNIRISMGSSVMEDILECDAVLYWGSSVALEGIRLGKPVIHFNQNDILSYDPLFGLADFKWVISSQDDIVDLFDQICIIPDNKFKELQDRARRYVIEYHNPVSKEALSPFLAF
jgi:hypothetical protein